MSSDQNGPVMPAGKWESVDTDRYDARWKQMAESGQNPHGEADFIERFGPSSVLDAGCGTGRVAIELHRRGCDVVGVDLDEPMIAAARRKAPEVEFVLADLGSVDLGRTFDVVAMPGNVMIFVAPGSEADVIANMAAHVQPGGHLVAGFQLGRGLSADTYDVHARAAGLEPAEHWSTWDCGPATGSSDYALIVHRRPASEAPSRDCGPRTGT